MKENKFGIMALLLMLSLVIITLYGSRYVLNNFGWVMRGAWGLFMLSMAIILFVKIKGGK